MARQQDPSNSLQNAVKGLSHSTAKQRRRSAITLAEAAKQSGPEMGATVPALREALKDTDRVVRHHAAWILGLIGSEATAAIPDLIAAMKDADADVRWDAAWAIGRIGPTVEAAPLLIAALNDADHRVRKDAVAALIRLGAAAVPGLMALLTGNAEVHARVKAVQSLRGIGVEAVPALIQALSSRKPEIRRMAAEVLKKMGPKAIQPLIEALPSAGDSADLCMAILDVVESFGPAAKPAIPALRELSNTLAKKPSLQNLQFNTLMCIFAIDELSYDRLVDSSSSSATIQEAGGRLSHDRGRSRVEQKRSEVAPSVSETPETISQSPERDTHIKEIFADLPGSFDGRTAALLSINATFRDELAKQLQSVLNTHVKELPYATYEEKKDLAKHVNEELRQFGLAIKCPNTGRPSILVAGPGHHPDIGRFQLDNLSPDGKRVRTYNTPHMFDFELMPDTPRREGRAKWADRSAPTDQTDGYNR